MRLSDGPSRNEAAGGVLLRRDDTGSRWCWILPLGFVLNEIVSGARMGDIIGWSSYEPIAFAPLVAGVSMTASVVVALSLLQAIRPSALGWLVLGVFVVWVSVTLVVDELMYSVRYRGGPTMRDCVLVGLVSGLLFVYARGRPHSLDEYVQHKRLRKA